jgi:hypothetical protein
MYQMTLKTLQTAIKYTYIFHSKALRNIPKLFFFCYENITSGIWQPWQNLTCVSVGMWRWMTSQVTLDFTCTLRWAPAPARKVFGFQTLAHPDMATTYKVGPSRFSHTMLQPEPESQSFDNELQRPRCKILKYKRRELCIPTEKIT